MNIGQPHRLPVGGFLLALSLALFLSSLTDSTRASKGDDAFETEQDASILLDRSARRSYALGVEIGKGLRNQYLEVKFEPLLLGVKHALSGAETLMSEREIRAVVEKLRRTLKQRQAARRSEQRLNNEKKGQAFLAENRTREGIVTRESGLQYQILEAGDGSIPTLEDTVVARYRGTLIDGTEFASSYAGEQPATFAVKGVIKGWQEALQLMPVGSKWRLFIPSRLAYGVRGAGPAIGPNATLVLDVELISVKDTPAGPHGSAKKGRSADAQADAGRQAPGKKAPPAVAGIKVAFKLDSRLTQGMYMGERWVSPATYTSTLQTGDEITLQARAHGLNTMGRRMAAIDPEWIATDPDRVTVSPGRGHEVKITVKGAGESSVQVAFGAVSKTLSIKSAYRGGAIGAQVSQ